MLIISGAMGAGRTTILSEVSDLLVEADVPHVVIDLDWLSIMHPAQPNYGERLVFLNLRACKLVLYVNKRHISWSACACNRGIPLENVIGESTINAFATTDGHANS